MKNLLIALCVVAVTMFLATELFVNGAQIVTNNDGWLIILGVVALAAGVLTLYYGMKCVRLHIRKYIDAP
jgi:uncharacterized membrane protein